MLSYLCPLIDEHYNAIATSLVHRFAVSVGLFRGGIAIFSRNFELVAKQSKVSQLWSLELGSLLPFRLRLKVTFIVALQGLQKGLMSVAAAKQ